GSAVAGVRPGPGRSSGGATGESETVAPALAEPRARAPKAAAVPTVIARRAWRRVRSTTVLLSTRRLCAPPTAGVPDGRYRTLRTAGTAKSTTFPDVSQVDRGTEGACGPDTPLRHAARGGGGASAWSRRRAGAGTRRVAPERARGRRQRCARNAATNRHWHRIRSPAPCSPPRCRRAPPGRGTPPTRRPPWPPPPPRCA